MTEIQASHINLRSADNQMVPLSQWTFGDFVANLVGGHLVDGYELHLTKAGEDKDAPLVLTAVGVESKTPYTLATSNQTTDENTTYTIRVQGNTIFLEGNDGSSSQANITTADGNTTYELKYDDNILSLEGSDGSKQEYTITSGSSGDGNTEYTLTLDSETNELVFHSTDEEVRDTRISINTGNYLDDEDFLVALMN